MALDIKGFVTPEQQFEGLYKLSEQQGKQKAEKAKAGEVDSAKKAALINAFIMLEFSAKR